MFRGGRGRGGRSRGWHQGGSRANDRRDNSRDASEGYRGGRGGHAERGNHSSRGHHGSEGSRGNTRGGQRGRGSKDWNSHSRKHDQRDGHGKLESTGVKDYSILCEHYLRGSCSAGDNCLLSHLAQPVFVSSGVQEPILAITILDRVNLIVCATRKSIFTYQAGTHGFKEYLRFPVDGEVTCLSGLEGEAHFRGSPQETVQITLFCTLFVGVSRPASPMGDIRHCTIVPVGTIQAWDFQYPTVDPISKQEMPTVHPCLDPANPMAHRHPVTAMAGILNASSSVPAILASGAGDGSIKVWTPVHGGMRCGAGCALTGEESHVRAVTALQFYQEPKVVRLISGSADGTVKVWNLSSLLPDALPPSSLSRGVHLTCTLPAPFTSVFHSAPRTAGLGMTQLARAALAHAAHGSPALSEGDVAVVSMHWIDMSEFREPVENWVLLVAYRSGHMRAWDMDTPDTPRLIEDQHAILTPDSGDKLLCMAVQDLNEAHDCGPAVLAVYDSGKVVAREIADAGLSDEQGRDQKSFTIPAGKKKEHPGQTGHAAHVTSLASAPNNHFVLADGEGKLMVWRLLPSG